MIHESVLSGRETQQRRQRLWHIAIALAAAVLMANLVPVLTVRFVHSSAAKGCLLMDCLAKTLSLRCADEVTSVGAINIGLPLQ